MSFYDDASLVFLAGGAAGKDGKAYSLKPTDGSGDFTFTRGTNLTATRVGKDGYIEKGRENLLKYSNTFDQTGNSSTGWALVANTGGTPPTVTSGYTGYDGSSDAWLLSSENDNYCRIEQNPTYTGVFTFSVYAKAGTANYMNLENGGIASDSVYFNLLDGSIESQGVGAIDASITGVGNNGWYRCSVTLSGTSSQQRIYASTSVSDVNAGAGSIYIQDAQFEAGLVATDYIETGATTATAGLLEDEPRFDYTGGGCPALLMEPTRTNYIEYSEYFNAWTKQGAVTITDNATTSPSGSNDASKYNISASTNRALDQTITLTSGVTYTFSMWVKAIVDTTIRVRSDANDWSEDISLLVSDGWKRIESTHTMGITEYEFGFFDASGSTGDRFYIWGAQLEEGSFATSYMPNYGAAATVTRAKEYNECSFSGIGSQGTVFGEVEIKDDGVYGTPVALSDGDSTTNFILVYKQGDNKLSYRIRTGGVDQTSIASAVLAEGYHKFAFRFKENDCDFFVNGEIVDSDTSATMPTGLDSIRQYIGTDTNKFHGGTKQLLYFPTVLSNNDTEILTGATSYSSFATMATSSALNYTIYE